MAMGIRAAALPLVLATLGACGGGGGGGGVVPAGPSEVPLTSFKAVDANQTVTMEGKSATLTLTTTSSGDAVDAGPIGDATVKFGYDSARELNAISVDTPQASFSFGPSTGQEVRCSGEGTCSAKGPDGWVIAVDPAVLGWNYQSYGIWAMVTGSNLAKLGAVSAGTATSGSSLPTTGSATFIGLATGHYIDVGGNLFATGALMRADVNFGSRNIGFSTSRTEKNGAKAEELNLSGTLSYAQGVNNFSGALRTDNGQLSGQGAGRFFGPAAEEIGGVYSLQGAGVSRMGGGFGGKR